MTTRLSNLAFDAAPSPASALPALLARVALTDPELAADIEAAIANDMEFALTLGEDVQAVRTPNLSKARGDYGVPAPRDGGVR